MPIPNAVISPATELRTQLEILAAAARAGLESVAPAELDIGFQSFPSGTCGPVSDAKVFDGDGLRIALVNHS